MKGNELVSTDVKAIRDKNDLSTDERLMLDGDHRMIPLSEGPSLISRDLTKAFNTQIGHEFGASMQYVGIAAHFQQRDLTLLANLFFSQAEEERQHAMKFVKYVLDVKGELQIPQIPPPSTTFNSAQEAVAAALKWEHEVTGQITRLMDHAVKENDYLAQSFLQWFVDEQLEEVVKMGRLLSVIRRSGERNLLMVEGYLSTAAKRLELKA